MPQPPLSLETLRRLEQECADTLTGLVEWPVFTLDTFQVALAKRLGGVIERLPFHWEEAGCFGLTVGTLGPDVPHWLVLYEAETDAEHQLAIILHEFIHILRGHARAQGRLTPAALRELLAASGLLPAGEATALYTRWCPTGDDTPLSPREAVEEREADLGAMWILTQVRRAGALPQAGRPFAAEHYAIDASLRADEDLP